MTTKPTKKKSTRHPKTTSSPKNQTQSFIAIEGESIFHANITPSETYTMSAMAEHHPTAKPWGFCFSWWAVRLWCSGWKAVPCTEEESTPPATWPTLKKTLVCWCIVQGWNPTNDFHSLHHHFFQFLMILHIYLIYNVYLHVFSLLSRNIMTYSNL